MKAAGAAVVGVTVWAEPTLKGLARRPAYAATLSGQPLDIPYSFALGRNDSQSVTVGGVTLTISRDNGNGYTIMTSSGTTLSGDISVDGRAPVTVAGGNPTTVNSGNNGNQTYTVIGTITCS